MFSPVTVIAIILLYVGFLFLVAQWTEGKLRQGINPAARPAIYALSLAVYHTSWTFYGSVGLAATSGLQFLTVYLGPTLFVIFWWTVLRKLVRIKSAYHIASIADFISARYDKSKGLAFLATLTALIGITPYIALQLKAVFSTFSILTVAETGPATWLGENFDLIVITLMILFTIIFGVRRLDPTERHEGMVMALAVECLVKLIAFLAAGIFVTFVLFDGFADIFGRLAASPHEDLLHINRGTSAPYVSWFSMMVLSASAVMFLPRQFHIAVVENSHEDHIRSAMWMFPLYMLLINLFVLPIAAGGLLQGYPLRAADTFVLYLPLASGKPWLGALVFLGGFSAAIGMIMISTVTLATMVSNHMLLPLLNVSGLSSLRQRLLQCRWGIVVLIVLLGYGFERVVGESHMLASMGMISFVAVLQFAPPILGGIFWREGNRVGALLGLGAGFFLWVYTSLLPAFIRSGWLPRDWLDRGPWGAGLMRPEQLFGLSGLDAVSHAMFWSLSCNIGLYVLGSLCFRQSRSEQTIAGEFVGILRSPAILPERSAHEGYIDLPQKCSEAQRLLSRFLPPSKAGETVERCLERVGIGNKRKITIVELTEFHSELEKWLAGSVGPATAHETMREGTSYSEREARELSDLYGEILANLRVTPEELRRKIDFYREREELLAGHARELERRVAERTEQLAAANRELEAFAYSVSHDLRAPLRGIEGFSRILQNDFSRYLPPQAHIFLDQVRDNAGKMGQLIEDLLAFSRLGRQPLRKETVHLDRLAKQILEELAGRQEGRRFEIVVGELPPGRADPNLLRVVLVNLLSNAVKFTSGRQTARIEVGARQEPEQVVYFVRDNGAGFDMRHAGKLFGVFQRLHSAEEFEGTGVGLATVQRILHRHGGDIWAEAEVDCGATFFFTLGSDGENEEGAEARNA